MPATVRIRVENRLINNDPVKTAQVVVDPVVTGPPVAAGVTNNNGDLTLDISTVPDGPHTVVITPANTTADAVGPAIASTGVAPDRIFRSFSFTITVSSHAVSAVTGQDANGIATFANGRISVRLQPVFIKSKNNGSRGSSTSSIVIVHHTGGTTIGSAINTFLSASTSAHYLVDTDGQVVKMVQDSRTANHAGVSRWAAHTSVNPVSIGIEIVNAGGAYPSAQIDGVKQLLQRIVLGVAGIDRRLIIGHSDIGTDGNGVLGRKSTDPGLTFPWTEIETLGYGLQRMVGPPNPAVFGNIYNAVTNAALRRNDNDADRRWSGAIRDATVNVTGSPVQELQQRLADIGYSVGTPDGVFSLRTHRAVQMFQEHFFAGGQGHKAPDGVVDFQTAALIAMVV